MKKLLLNLSHMDILKLLLQFLLYPLRIIWSRYFYPPQAYSKKTTSDHNYFEIKSANPSNFYVILVPGIGVEQFDPQYLKERKLFDLDQLDKAIGTQYHLELIPPPSYRYTYTSFSLKSWAKTINSRINEIENINPQANIVCIGVSMGGAATAIAATRSNTSKEAVYVVVNTFSSLSQFIWEQSWIAFISFSIHFIPITLLLLIIGSATCKIVYLIGLSALISILTIITFSSLYLKIENFFINLNNLYYNSYQPVFIQRSNHIIKMLYKAICHLVHFLFLTIYIPTHWITHSFTYLQIWLLDSNTVLSKLKFGKNCIITQSTLDSVIPFNSRLLTHIKDTSKFTYIQSDKTEHGTVIHKEIFGTQILENFRTQRTEQ